MKSKLLCVAALTLFAVMPTALASSSWYVDGINGSDNNHCKSPQHAGKTIGHAISLASSGDSVMVGPATYTENLNIGLSLKIVGVGAKTTIIDGGGVTTVVTISSSTANVTLSKMTIRNGVAGSGGGISNIGTLTINNSTISGNRGTIKGGGISNGGVLTINDSTISGNMVNYRNASGGGIFNYSGTLAINNSTISGNTAFGTGRGFVSGGGIDDHRSTLTINNSTISGNTAAGGFLNAGGGISNGSASTVTLQNSIVANNFSVAGNCTGAMTSDGHNLSSDNTCHFNNTGDLNNTDPKLGQLGNHGGPTQTILCSLVVRRLMRATRAAARMALVIC